MDAQVDPPVNTLFRTLYAQYNTPKYALLEALEPPRHGLPTPMAIVHRYGFPKNGNSDMRACIHGCTTAFRGHYKVSEVMLWVYRRSGPADPGYVTHGSGDPGIRDLDHIQGTFGGHRRTLISHSGDISDDILFPNTCFRYHNMVWPIKGRSPTLLDPIVVSRHFCPLKRPILGPHFGPFLAHFGPFSTPSGPQYHIQGTFKTHSTTLQTCLRHSISPIQ